MIKLGVNIDHVATLRQARGTIYPDPVQAASEAEQAGADIITLHLREDRRHIQLRDVEILKQTMQTRMNLEMAVTDEMIAIAEKIQPQDCCLVPERRQELTTEGGLDVAGQMKKIESACRRLKEAGMRVSLFVDADHDQINAARECHAPVIEIHTGHFSNAESESQVRAEFVRIQQAVSHGLNLGLQVNAGHGLHYHNVQQIAVIPGISELNIGHSIIGRALFTGLQNAVREMRQLIQAAEQPPAES